MKFERALVVLIAATAVLYAVDSAHLSASVEDILFVVILAATAYCARWALRR